MEWTGWLEAAGKGATLVASVMAIVGIGTWRRDFSGKRNIELAEETLILFYRAADAIRAMRSPGAFEHEFAHVVQKDGESPHTFTARKMVAPLFQRHEHYSELFASIQATRYRYMARFGKNAGAPFDDLRRLDVRILVTARGYVRLSTQYDPEGIPGVAERQREGMERNEAVFWDSGDDDEINTELKRIVAVVEGQCRGIIESQFLLRSWWRWVAERSKRLATAVRKRFPNRKLTHS